MKNFFFIQGWVEDQKTFVFMQILLNILLFVLKKSNQIKVNTELNSQWQKVGNSAQIILFFRRYTACNGYSYGL